VSALFADGGFCCCLSLLLLSLPFAFVIVFVFAVSRYRSPPLKKWGFSNFLKVGIYDTETERKMMCSAEMMCMLKHTL
jgi:hypothetical protein